MLSPKIEILLALVYPVCMATSNSNTNMAPTLAYARIVSSYGNLDYQLTPEDVIWAAKMATYEGDAEEVLWTMTQRFALTYPGQQWGSFTEFIRSFSQPINPDWYSTGKHCQPGGKGYRSDYCSEELTGRREALATMTWDEVAAEYPRAVKITLQWAQGNLTNPVPRAVNFAAPAQAQQYAEQRDDVVIIQKANNWFLAEMGTDNWHPKTVTMKPGSAVVVAQATRKGYYMNVFLAALTHPTKLFSGKPIV